MVPRCLVQSNHWLFSYLGPALSIIALLFSLKHEEPTSEAGPSWRHQNSQYPKTQQQQNQVKTVSSNEQRHLWYAFCVHRNLQVYLTFPAYHFTECCEIFPAYLCDMTLSQGNGTPHRRTLCLHITRTKVANDQLSGFSVFQLPCLNTILTPIDHLQLTRRLLTIGANLNKLYTIQFKILHKYVGIYLSADAWVQQ